MCMTVTVLHALQAGYSAFVFALRDSFLFNNGPGLLCSDHGPIKANRDCVSVAVNVPRLPPSDWPRLCMILQPGMTSVAVQVLRSIAASMNVSCNQNLCCRCAGVCSFIRISKGAHAVVTSLFKVCAYSPVTVYAHATAYSLKLLCLCVRVCVRARQDL